MTSTGGAGELTSAGQGQAAGIGCRCLPMSARPGRLPARRPASAGEPAGVPAGAGPGRAMTPQPVTMRGRRAACERAGLPAGRAPAAACAGHRDAARRGAALPEIGQVLRHASAGDDRDLREGRPAALRSARPAMAGSTSMSDQRSGPAGLPGRAPRSRLQARPRTALLPERSSAISSRPGPARSPPSWRWPGSAHPRAPPPGGAAADPGPRLRAVPAHPRPGHRGPAARLVASGTAGPRRYLYSAADITGLMSASRALPTPLRAATSRRSSDCSP